MKLATYLYLVLKLKMSAALYILHMFAVMVWTGTSLPLP
jgi:hypothetical protein